MNLVGLTGFIICNASGERITQHPDAEEATRLMRLIPAALEVVRASDGALIAYKHHTPKSEMNWMLRGAA